MTNDYDKYMKKKISRDRSMGTSIENINGGSNSNVSINRYTRVFCAGTKLRSNKKNHKRIDKTLTQLSNNKTRME